MVYIVDFVLFHHIYYHWTACDIIEIVVKSAIFCDIWVSYQSGFSIKTTWSCLLLLIFSEHLLWGWKTIIFCIKILNKVNYCRIGKEWNMRSYSVFVLYIHRIKENYIFLAFLFSMRYKKMRLPCFFQTLKKMFWNIFEQIISWL